MSVSPYSRHWCGARGRCWHVASPHLGGTVQEQHALSARRCPHKLAARTGLTRNSTQVATPEPRPVARQRTTGGCAAYRPDRLCERRLRGGIPRVANGRRRRREEEEMHVLCERLDVLHGGLHFLRGLLLSALPGKAVTCARRRPYDRADQTRCSQVAATTLALEEFGAQNIPYLYIAVAAANVIAIPILTYIGGRCVVSPDPCRSRSLASRAGMCFLPRAFELTVWLMICTHRRAYQRSILFWSVVLSMGTLGGLWYALVQTKLNDDLVPDGGDGSSSNDGGTFSERQLLRRYVVVTVFLTVEILVRASS